MVIDRLRADQLGVYGNLPTDTPSMDSLAARGTFYTRAYTPSSAVEPARSSVYTGRLPPEHGHRLDSQRAETAAFGSWVGALGGQPCVTKISVTEYEKSSFEVDKCVTSGTQFVVVELSVEGASIGVLDEVIGDVSRGWEAHRGSTLGALVGLVGEANDLRQEARFLLTDDLLRVPLITWAPGGRTEWQDDRVVSTARLGTILSVLQEQPSGEAPIGVDELAYHESTRGYDEVRARPLRGYTDREGRYVEGEFGRWYPARGEVVRGFEDPESGYPEKARKLNALVDSIEQGQGLPSEAWSEGPDPANLMESLLLIEKVRTAIERRRTGAAKRMLSRLKAGVGEVPVVLELEDRLQLE